MTCLRRLIWILVAVCVCSCSKGPPKDHVILWTAFDGAEEETLRRRVQDFTAETGHQVTLLKVPFKTFQRKVLVAGPALQGPDILIGPHDWIGLLETAELLAPIPDDIIHPRDERYFEVATQAVTYAGAIYSAPMMMDCVVLARNTELCPEKPTSLEGLVRIAQSCQNKETGVRGFSYKVDNFYFSWGFIAGFGADFLTPFRNKELNLDSIEFATPGAVEGLDWVADLRQKHKLVEDGMDNQIAVDLFLNKKLAMMICGPWNLGAIRKAGIPYALEPLPPGPAGDSSPFVGVTGAMLGKHSTDKAGVKELLAFLASPETGAALCESSGRAPTRLDTADLLKERVEDPAISSDLNLFSQAAQNGTPMPNHPAMSAVWAPIEDALELVTTGQSGAENELKRTTQRVRAKIRFMTE